ncbi:MAG: signal recognition particle protein [Candidatus Izemoplasmatales bacterium]|nr:signal recognition particle protein [Candidatus Izemoplasmatales bacterium]MDD4355115.1 signal recognition particle protein [Candidatus Izemoplasmatales bacterium]MDD5601769.1 signal recognition particle protein [Candidatus Izemoplasmatales bacterium]MDY0373796.1 signal recognition particle protein [Candidatus Izemoplasmatales bacterium]
MAFENLTSRMQMAFRRLVGKARLTEADMEEMLREVRLSLLEADVNYKVVKEFTEEIKELAFGERILKGLNPDQQVIKIVSDELKKLMGSDAVSIQFKDNDITVIMMVGLQGTGKTTTAGKLANFLRKTYQKKPLLVAADIYRPAAIDQLETVGKQLNIPVFSLGISEKPVHIAEKALKYAKEQGCDLVIIDTAGRLHINETLMDELVSIKKVVKPGEILLTVDAMTGQDALTVATAFHEALSLSGCILTKLDGDTRGGAALSIRKVTGIPIKFSGTGEKLTDLETFHPERMASRILGMGDIVSLAEKAAEEIDETEAMSMMEKMMTGTFNFNDLLKQLKMIKRMGALSGILKFLPGMSGIQSLDKVDDRQLVYIEAIIHSMTPEERKKPELVERSSGRRSRIARGAGRSTTEVNRLLSMLEKQQKMFRQMSSMKPETLEKLVNDPPMPNQFRQDPNKGKKGGQ